MSIVIVQKTLVHVLSAMCEQSERERERMAERHSERERESETDRQTDRQRNSELCFYLFDSFTNSL